MSYDRKFRIGIIGTGNVALKHLKAIKNQPDVELVAGADIIEGKAAAFFAANGVEGVRCYSSGAEMIADKSLALDGVTVCTHNRQHAACAIEALDAGLDVLLEKPFTVTTEEALAVMEAEKRSGRILSIGFQPRMDENMKKVKEIVQSGILGEVYYVQTGGGRRRGIPVRYGTEFIEDKTAGFGALGDIGCYSLDMVLNALGNPRPLTVSGYTSARFGRNPEYSGYTELSHPEYASRFEVDDFAAAFIRLEGDVVVDFRISWAMNCDTPGDTVFLGTKGGLRIPSTECWNGTVGGDLVIYHDEDGKPTETVIPRHIPAPDEPTNFDKKIRTFVDACRSRAKSPIPSDEIIYNQAILDAIARSAKLGREVTVALPEEL